MLNAPFNPYAIYPETAQKLIKAVVALSNKENITPEDIQLADQNNTALTKQYGLEVQMNGLVLLGQNGPFVLSNTSIDVNVVNAEVLEKALETEKPRKMVRFTD